MIDETHRVYDTCIIIVTVEYSPSLQFPAFQHSFKCTALKVRVP